MMPEPAAEAMVQEHYSVQEGAEEKIEETERHANIRSAARCSFSDRLGQLFRITRSYLRPQAGNAPLPSPIAPDLARVLDENENNWITALSVICISLIVWLLFLLIGLVFIRTRLDPLKDIVEGNATLRDDPGIIQRFVADKIPSDMWMVANPCTCLGNGTVSFINKTDVGFCTNESWWNPTSEDGKLAMTLEQMYGPESFAKYIVVAATYVCERDPTCFRQVTEAALTTAEAMTEMMCFVKKSTETGKCKGADMKYCIAFGEMSTSLSSPLAMLVALFNKKVKRDISARIFRRVIRGDIAPGVFQPVPFKTICSNTVTNPLYVLVCSEHPMRQRI